VVSQIAAVGFTHVRYGGFRDAVRPRHPPDIGFGNCNSIRRSVRASTHPTRESFVANRYSQRCVETHPTSCSSLSCFPQSSRLKPRSFFKPKPLALRLRSSPWSGRLRFRCRSNKRAGCFSNPFFSIPRRPYGTYLNAACLSTHMLMPVVSEQRFALYKNFLPGGGEGFRIWDIGFGNCKTG